MRNGLLSWPTRYLRFAEILRGKAGVAAADPPATAPGVLAGRALAEKSGAIPDSGTDLLRHPSGTRHREAHASCKIHLIEPTLHPLALQFKTAYIAIRTMVGCSRFQEKLKADDKRHKRIPGAAVGWVAVDGCVAACLHSILGLGQSHTFVRRRGDPWLRGIVVGKFVVDIEPGGQLTGGRDPLVCRCRLASRDRAISGRRNGIHVGR